MSSTHDAALAFLIAQHVQESAQAARESMTVTVKVTMNPKAPKSKGPKNEAAPIQRKSGTPGITMPDRGTLDAKGFLFAMRSAGVRRSETGAAFVNAQEKRNDEIKAIHAFMYEIRKGVKVAVGYDPNRDFGSQEQAARMLAQREIRGPVKVSEVAKPSLSAAGYVAGMPDSTARTLADLRAQAVKATDIMIECEKAGNSVGAAIERERLDHIYAQIKSMGYEV